jgi:hypothetical protein
MNQTQMLVTSHCDECHEEFELAELEDWKCFNCRTMIEIVEFCVLKTDLLEYLEDGMTPSLKYQLKRDVRKCDEDCAIGFHFRIYEESKTLLGQLCGENINYMNWIIEDYYDKEVSNLIMKRMNNVSGSSCFAAWLCNFDDEEYVKSISITSILSLINRGEGTTKEQSNIRGRKIIEDVLVRMNQSKKINN